MELWSAVVIGFFGSVHCAVMCGPIAMSLPLSAEQKMKAVAELLTYNLGRIMAYMAIGFSVGLFGRAFFYSGLQQQLSIAMGVIVIVSVILFSSAESRVLHFLRIDRFRLWITGWFGVLMNKKGILPILGIGMINGFLPCGLVYVAIAGAFTRYDMISSIAYMAVFGLGTLPMMLGVVVFGRTFSRRLKIKALTPYLALVMGVLFILRGLELNIPYVSPLIEPTVAATCGK